VRQTLCFLNFVTCFCLFLGAYNSVPHSKTKSSA
jgi:hypothetical protein